LDILKKLHRNSPNPVHFLSQRVVDGTGFAAQKIGGSDFQQAIAEAKPEPQDHVFDQYLRSCAGEMREQQESCQCGAERETVVP
jgi:hypothetical protein